MERRADVIELLEQPDIDRNELERSLSDLEWANRWLGGMSAVRPYLIPMIFDGVSFLDLGCGGGDMLRVLSREAAKRRIRLNLTGVDINPAVLSIARQRCSGYTDISLLKADATRLPFKDKCFDVVYSSTLLHHLDPPMVICALQEALRIGLKRLVFSDLVRSKAGLIGVWMIGRVVFGRLSRHDGAASFKRAYSPGELQKMANQAGLGNCSLKIHRFYRMTLACDSEAHR